MPLYKWKVAWNYAYSPFYKPGSSNTTRFDTGTISWRNKLLSTASNNLKLREIEKKSLTVCSVFLNRQNLKQYKIAFSTRAKSKIKLN